AAVRLGSPVERVAWDAEGVRLGAGGAELEAHVCVVAVPAGVLHRIAFEPALPPQPGEALAAVRFGEAAKLFVPLRRSTPPSAVMSVPDRYWTWTATGARDEPQPVVSAFAGSSGALERLGVATGAERWLASLERLRPDLELDPGGALLSTWSDDPWAGAAYSTSPPPELAEASERPVGPLVFAGEHLGGPFAALMEGAIRSGRAAARALLAR
ncbi:MAG: FAD-dependent oxidoreductase, partial [Thermoleophilaceae bacterium]|nr:FAD-dependent oxidoreductase [Thermoleophilaceae bacterium]